MTEKTPERGGTQAGENTPEGDVRFHSKNAVKADSATLFRKIVNPGQPAVKGLSKEALRKKRAAFQRKIANAEATERRRATLALQKQRRREKWQKIPLHRRIAFFAVPLVVIVATVSVVVGVRMHEQQIERERIAAQERERQEIIDLPVNRRNAIAQTAKEIYRTDSLAAGDAYYDEQLNSADTPERKAELLLDRASAVNVVFGDAQAKHSLEDALAAEALFPNSTSALGVARYYKILGDGAMYEKYRSLYSSRATAESGDGGNING